MTYRHPSAPGPADDAEARLARLAEEGRQRQTVLALRESREREVRAQASLAPSSEWFRLRFKEQHYGHLVAIFGGSLAAFVVATFVLASSAGEIAWGILMSVTVFGWVVACPVWMVVHWFLVRRDADRVRDWHGRLPFPFPSFVPTLSTSGFIRDGSLIARFGAPPSFDVDLVRGLLGCTTTPRANVVVKGRELRIEGVGDLQLGGWIREMVEKVLLPIHAAHVVEEVELRVDVTAMTDESASGD